MGRNRIISQNKALFVTATGLLPSFYAAGNEDVPASGVHATQLHRVDTLSFETDLASARTDVREFGQLARIASLRTSDINPTVSLGYYLTDGENEHHLGFNIQGIGAGDVNQSQFISGMLTESPSKRAVNLFALVVEEGQDAFNSAQSVHGNNVSHDVVAFGNCVLSSYSAEFAVGEIPRADVEFQAANIDFLTGTNSGTLAREANNPALTLDATASADSGTWALPVPDTGDGLIDVLRPGDVTLTFGAGALDIGGMDLSDVNAQSVSFDVPLSRTPLESLGSQFAEFKPIDFPLDVTMSVNAFVKDFSPGSLKAVLTGAVDAQAQDITVSVRDRNEADRVALVMRLKDAILDSQNFSLGLDDNESVDLQFSVQIAGATNTDIGMFMSGAYDGVGVVGKDVATPSFYTIA